MSVTCELLIVGGRIVDIDAPSGSLDDHAVAIGGREVVDVGPTADLVDRWTSKRTIDAAGGVISPGFVDAHVHLSAYLAMAAPYARPTEPGRFSGGSNVAEIVPFVAELTSMQLPAELTSVLLRPVFAAMLKSGITSVVDAGSAGHDGLVSAAVDVGIRASIGASLADRWHGADGEIGRRAEVEQQLDAARAVIDAHDRAGDGRIRGLVSAVETIACSDELLTGIADLADGLDVPINIHSHITEASDAAHLAEYGASATERLARTGMLNPRCTAMHVGNATDDDIAAFAEAGLTVNHNPLGNAMFGFATAQQGAIPKMIDAGIPLVLGSDYAGSMIATPFDSIKAALSIHREAGGADDTISFEDVIAMATNPGVAVGQPGRVGRLAVGQLADVVVVDTTGSHHLGDRHPVPSLALRARASDVTTVVVNGELVVDGGELTTIDESAALAEAQGLLASMR